MTKRAGRPLAVLATVAVLLLPLGCGDDGTTQSSGQQATLDRMWPNEDGRFWSYDLSQRTWGFDAAYDASPVPLPLPPLRDLAVLAAERNFPPGSTLVTGTFRLEFDDSITTSSGVTRQHLVETLTLDPKAAGSMRPATHPGSGHPAATELLSLSLHGGAWEKTTEQIAGYGDLEMELPWKYLESDLSTGHEFVHPLFPGSGVDVLLRARVLGTTYVETAAGIYTQALDVFYVLDFGVSEATDEQGNFAGYLHQLSYGSIYYVPGIGPVAGYERMMTNYGPNGLERGYAELTHSLRETGMTP